MIFTLRLIIFYKNHFMKMLQDSSFLYISTKCLRNKERTQTKNNNFKKIN